MTAQIIGGIITVLSVLLGSGSVLGLILKQRGKEPLPREEAAVAVARDGLDPATKAVTDALARQLAAQAETHAMEIASLRTEMSILSGRLTRWAAWYDDLAGRWLHHRAQDKPPAAPQ